MSGITGAIVGWSGGHGWTNPEMGGDLILDDFLMEAGENFMQHAGSFLLGDFFVKFTLGNVIGGVLNGVYNRFLKGLNKRGVFFGI